MFGSVHDVGTYLFVCSISKELCRRHSLRSKGTGWGRRTSVGKLRQMLSFVQRIESVLLVFDQRLVPFRNGIRPYRGECTLVDWLNFPVIVVERTLLFVCRVFVDNGWLSSYFRNKTFLNKP